MGEFGLALAAVFLAREALRPDYDRRQTGSLAVAGGVVHGLGWASVAGGTGPVTFAGALVVANAE